MLNSRHIKAGDRILLAYDHEGGTIPPDRIVEVTMTDETSFSYRLQLIMVGGIFVTKDRARELGVRFRQGRAITHDDFIVNMSQRSRRV